MPNIRTKDLIKGYRTGKSEVIALRSLDMQVADRELVAHIAHRVFEIQNGKILGETAAA